MINIIDKKEVSNNDIIIGVNVVTVIGDKCLSVGRWIMEGEARTVAWSVVRNDIDNSIMFFGPLIRSERYGIKSTRSEFLEFVKRNYPADFELILWHPEILEARYEV